MLLVVGGVEGVWCGGLFLLVWVWFYFEKMGGIYFVGLVGEGFLVCVFFIVVICFILFLIQLFFRWVVSRLLVLICFVCFSIVLLFIEVMLQFCVRVVKGFIVFRWVIVLLNCLCCLLRWLCIIFVSWYFSCWICDCVWWICGCGLQ